MESLGFLAIMVLAFWLLIIRPARTRARKQTQMQNELAPGQEVMTTAGLFATVAAVEDDAVVLEAAPGVRTRWAKAAVARIVPPAQEPDEPADIDITDATTSSPTSDPTTNPTTSNPTTGRAE